MYIYVISTINIYVDQAHQTPLYHLNVSVAILLDSYSKKELNEIKRENSYFGLSAAIRDSDPIVTGRANSTVAQRLFNP